MTEEGRVELRWRAALHPVHAGSLVAFSAVLLSIAFRRGQFQTVHRATMFAAALGLAYALLVQLINVTRLSREGGLVRVVHGPLPWRSATVVPVEEIRSLRCDPHSRRLVLRTAIGEEIVLVENLPRRELESMEARLRRGLRLDVRS